MIKMLPGGDAVAGGVSSSNGYPGGKSGAGIYQRLINLIPPHRVFVSAFAGHCGVTRRIRPAEHTIVIDACGDVCEWWDSWRRSPKGRDLEIHHCDSIEWLRFRFGVTEYSASGSGDAADCGSSRDLAAVSRGNAAAAGDALQCGKVPETETFVFCDPPYVMSQRASGRLYPCELSDADHERLLSTLTSIPAAAAAVLLCGYRSPVYAAVDREWRSIDHRVPTRGGLQDERMWFNYAQPARLHDYRFLGDGRRSRERIRRRQKKWVEMLSGMRSHERAAMLEAIILSFATPKQIFEESSSTHDHRWRNK